MSKEVIELIRVSTKGQAAEDRGGIPAQKAANRRTAAQYGLKIVKTIELADVSGTAVLATPEIRELLRLMESPAVHGVVTKEFSRLMRPENFSDFALLQAFVNTNTILYLPEGPIDLSSKSGRLLGTIRAAISGLERTEILERIWLAKEEKRKVGKHPQGTIALPFGVGYDSQAGRWFYKPESEKVREAFRLFLAGVTSYWEVGRRVGIEPFNLRIILRNPVYTGWRVYDKRRDPSPGAIRHRPDGRQADRPKIPRDPSEVIRVKVLEPLITEAEFQRVHNILDLKKQNHWRSRPDYEHRFVYHGFLRCGTCGNRIYTHVRSPHDWYVCKSRTTAERKRREQGNLDPCTNPYMRREHLEASINHLFSIQFQDSKFLGRVADAYGTRLQTTSANSQLVRVQRELEELKRKRLRVLDAYFENLISGEERDRRIAEIEADMKFYQDVALRAETPVQSLTAEDLANALSPFYEWEFLSSSEKRQLLQASVPEIYVKEYQVAGLTVLGSAVDRNEINHTGKGSSRRPA